MIRQLSFIHDGKRYTTLFGADEYLITALEPDSNVVECGKILASGGFIVQLLPDATDADITYIENALKDFPPVSSLIHEGLNPEEILLKLMSDVEILGSQDLDFECGCSKDNFSAALMTLGKSEIISMIEEDGQCEINCQFCNTKYHFSKEELEELVSQM